MHIQEHVPLNTYSTFMVGAKARYFAEVSSAADFQDLLKTEIYQNNPSYILGQGSNTLFASDYNGLVIHNHIQGLEVINEDDETITIEVGAGEDWNHLVSWSLNQGLWGLENLVLIPGTVGASPVQNVGAYGAEVSDLISLVRAVDTQTGDLVELSNKNCEFSYRNSLFKQKPGRYFITHVHFVLKKQGEPKLSYGRVQEEVQKLGIEKLEPKHIAQAVVTIRDSKLPRVGDLGTAGSFFKNPVVEKEKADELLKNYPDMKVFPTEDGQVKLSAAWLIDHLGYKGKRDGAVGTYENHALVLVNHGGAQGKEVWDFAQNIITDVHKEFGVNLEPEVRVIR
jgi:UDP-N-acetylmuramate dehydrogenase